jgi:peptidoglycan/xylan/chitin deacetylase (PgdA/CDA1 family)
MPYLALAPDLFEEQLATLRRLGFRSGGFADLARLAAGERLEGPTAFLTFDDGFRDNLLVAQPMMAEYGFRPLVFVLPPDLDEGRGFDWPEMVEAREENPDVMRSVTWHELERMVESGAEVGSHTLSHPHLPELDDDRLAAELVDSRRAIEGRLGGCDALAYPFGEWDGRVAAAASAAGYRFAFTLPQRHQREVGPLCIPRLNVDYRDRSSRFRLKLRPSGRRLLLSRTGDLLRAARPGGG